MSLQFDIELGSNQVDSHGFWIPRGRRTFGKPGVCQFGGGSGRSTTTVTPQPIQIPPELLPLVNQSVADITAFQQAFPLISLMQNIPTQQISNLTPMELALLGQQVGMSQAPAVTVPELDALSIINSLAGGPIGSSPATLAGMTAFNQLVAPQISQTAALAGQAQGGGIVEAMQQGATAAAVPLIQQEIADRMGVLLPLSGIGSSVADRETQNLLNAQSAAAMPRQIADAQNQAAFNAAMTALNLGTSVDLGVFNSLIPSLIPPPGQVSKTRQSSPGIWSGLAKK